MAAPEALIAGRYRLIRQLGSGGMGVVWEARDERLDRLVAIKQLRIQPGLTQEETDLVAQRAMREARINARLHHPYAVAVFDVVEEQDQPCIVMELVPSVPLTDVIRTSGALAPSAAARIGSQVAAALAAAHSLGIVHRDVKPGNVLIGDDGAARICDFGISRVFGDTSLTMTGMINGTPAFLAPETARGEESTFASDVYSLGATLYAAVEGDAPSGTDANAIAVLYRVAAGEVRPPVRAGELGPLLSAMMNARPQDRPSMADAAAHLSSLAGAVDEAVPDPAAQTEPIPAPAPASPTRLLPTTTSVLPPAPDPDATRQRSTVPTWGPPPSAPASTPMAAQTKRRRGGLVAVIALLIIGLVIAGIALLAPNLRQPAAGSSPQPTTSSGPGSTSAEPTSTEPSATESSAGSAGNPTTAELSQAVTDYYGFLPDDTDAGWARLTSSYQRQTGGRESYEEFWKDMDTVTVSDVQATAPDRVQATVVYVQKSGNRRSSERRTFRLVRSDGVLKINQSSVI